MPPLWHWLGRVAFAGAAALQERLRADVLAERGGEALLLCEHDPVVTLGRHAPAADVIAPAAELARRGIARAPATRGGGVTYHGPGQLVGYPIVRLRRGVVGHVTAMARALVAVLGELGLDAHWRRDAPGLWIGDDKICAFGVNVHRRVAIHGFALNIATDLDAFDAIVPCGIPGARVTSVRARLGAAPALATLAPRVARALGRELEVAFAPAPIEMSNRIVTMMKA